MKNLSIRLKITLWFTVTMIIVVIFAYLAVFAVSRQILIKTIQDSLVQNVENNVDEIEYHSDLGTVLHISGADLMDGTPIYDIKPYLPYVDSHPEAKGGFTDHIEEHILKVKFPEELLQKIPESQREALIEVLANDPRPRYQKNPERVYGIAYGENDVHFKVREEILYVCDVIKLK